MFIEASDDFDRVNLFLFQFLSHQIHPYAYAVKTFLQPAHEQCLRMISTNPQETFQLVLSLIQTFLRFIPESDLIFDEIQQFAIQLKETLNRCLVSLDAKTTEEFSTKLQTLRENLNEIIEQTDEQENVSRIAMYKHVQGILTNLEKNQSKTKSADPVQVNANDDQTKNDLSTIVAEQHPLSADISSTSSNNPSMFESSLNNSHHSKDDQSDNEKILSSTKFRVDAPAYQPVLDVPPGFEFMSRANNDTSNVIWSNGELHNERPKIPIDILRYDSTRPHQITSRYAQEFHHQSNRPRFFGHLSMNYGEPQCGPQTTCLPIGVALSYDESTLFSCDVHRNAESIRLFDVQTGRLKHTINNHGNIKMRRPSAIMSTASDNIVIVERDLIHLMTPDGRLIQTINDRSIKQLYGIGLFHDRYLLTLDSKAVDEFEGEVCRLLLFDPAYGQLVSEQRLAINHQPSSFLQTQTMSHVRGKILHENHSKPRFLAVQGDQIFIADLGRSVIYGLTLSDASGLNCTTVFGGHGRGLGEMVEPSGICIDLDGNVISADSRNDRVQLFSSDGEILNDIHFDEHVRRPSGICMNRDGTQLYVSCYLAGCVRAFELGY